MSRSRKKKGSGPSSDPGVDHAAGGQEKDKSMPQEVPEELEWDKDFLGDDEQSESASVSSGGGDEPAQEEDEFLGAPVDDAQEEAEESRPRRERPPELRAAPGDSRPLQPRPLSQGGVEVPSGAGFGETADVSAESSEVAGDQVAAEGEETTGEEARATARVPRPLGAPSGRYTGPVSSRVRVVTSSYTGRHLVAGQTAQVGGGGAYHGPVAQPSKAPPFLAGLGCGIVLALLLVAATPLSGLLGLQGKREAESQALRALELEQRHVEGLLSSLFPEQYIQVAEELRYWREENREPDPLDQVFRGMRYRPESRERAED